jgi:hypothetical protein
MSLVHFEGFEHQNVLLVDDFGAKAFGLTPGHGRAYMYYTSWPVYQYIRIPSWGEHATIYLGIRYRRTGGNGTNIYFQSDMGGLTHGTIQLLTAGQIALRFSNAGTLRLTTDPGIVRNENWNYVEMKYTLHDTTGEMTVRVNGGEVATWTGDTKNGGSKAVLDTIMFAPASGNNNQGSDWDDFYICTGDAVAPFNTWLGDVRVLSLLPTTAGQYDDLAAVGQANARLAMAQLPTNGANYAHSNVHDAASTFEVETPTHGASDSLYAVMTRTQALKDLPGPARLRHRIRIAGTDYDSEDLILSTTMSGQKKLWADNPAGGSWDRAAVEALEMGPVVRQS